MQKRNILKNKLYLYLTEFFAGMSVMAVELGASRLLAPYFSSSQIVWTIIIGTIMIAMALGNIYGGKSADKNPNPDRLYIRMLIAALWIAAIPFAGKYIIVGISALLIVAVNNNFLIIAAFAACMIIFVFPLFLLGTVTPSLARYTVESLDESGKTVGTLGAFNTVGSIIGTFLPTFVTIPAVGTSVTFLIFSGILFVLSAVYFLSKREKAVKITACAVAFALLSAAGAGSSFAFWDNSLTYEGESVYNYLQVKETDDSVLLATNVLFGVQSVKMKDGELTGMYYDYAMAAPALAGLGEEDSADILILGMGTGTYASQLLEYYPGFNVQGVEIDDKITALARKYFELDSKIKVTTYDGRAFLQADKEKYDVIMVDAYQDITIPFQMSSAEFFSLVKEHLKDNGVMVVNLNMRSSQAGDINSYLCDTAASVFGEIATADVPQSTNREMFACASGSVDTGALERAAENASDPALKRLYKRIAGNITEYSAGENILTDDKAPVELLGMSVIDGLIDNEIGFYRDIFKEKGISGLISELQ